MMMIMMVGVMMGMKTVVVLLEVMVKAMLTVVYDGDGDDGDHSDGCEGDNEDTGGDVHDDRDTGNGFHARDCDDTVGNNFVVVVVGAHFSEPGVFVF